MAQRGKIFPPDGLPGSAFNSIQTALHGKVKTGRHNSASEVVRETLRLFEERDRDLALRRRELRKKIREGIDSLRLGAGVDGEAVFDRLWAEVDARDVASILGRVALP